MPLLPVDYDPFGQDSAGGGDGKIGPGEPTSADRAVDWAMGLAGVPQAVQGAQAVQSAMQGNLPAAAAFGGAAALGLAPMALGIKAPIADLAGAAAQGVRTAAGGGAAERAGIRAFHGSPYDFDAFDLNKIGTGEGAQAYGEGMYFAESEPVAKGYRDRLAPPAQPLSFYYYPGGTSSPQNLFDPLVNRNLLPADVRNGGMELYTRLSPYKPEYINDDMVKRVYGELQQTINNFETYHAQGKTLLGRPLADEQRSLQDARDAKKVLDLAGYGETQPNPWDESVKINFPKPSTGKVYEVNINADPDSFLHWDQPLNQQPAGVQDRVKQALAPSPDALSYWRDRLQQDFDENAPGGYSQGRFDRAVNEATNHGGYGPEFGNRVWDELKEAAPGIAPEFQDFLSKHGVGIDPTDTGRQAYGLLESKLGNSGQASEVLRNAGISGVKYLDAGSRNAGNGTHNYVVFDPKMIQILRKYGLAGLIAGGANTIAGNADAATHLVPVDHDPFANSSDTTAVPPLPY